MADSNMLYAYFWACRLPQETLPTSIKDVEELEIISGELIINLGTINLNLKNKLNIVTNYIKNILMFSLLLVIL